MNNIIYIGVNDRETDLFENQYKVPNGVSYNSYLIKDEKIAVMDTVDSKKTAEWLENLAKALDGKKPDYLVVSHLEPDHSGSIGEFMKAYPNTEIVGNAKTFAFLPQFCKLSPDTKTLTVKEGDELSLGNHTLKFLMAPMIHWPEVMFTYETTEKILFSADGFGKFGDLNTDEEWLDEARRYYFNIVGKYGVQVQAVLKKLSDYEINAIYPLHGTILNENLGFYVDKYNTWSSYAPEEKGIFIAYASIHGNTAKTAKELARILSEKTDDKITVADLSRSDISECVANAFRYDRIILASSTYDGGIFPCMEDFLSHLKAKNYQNRTVGIIENGTWAPMSGKLMKAYLESMKNIKICQNTVTLRSSMNDDTAEALEKLADEIVSS